MPSPWNDTTDRQLLLIMIELAAPTPPKWDQVAQHMGEGFTAESTRQHFQKMRREIKAQIGDVSGTSKSNGKRASSTPATPKKTKTKTNGTPASKKRKIKASSDDEETKEEDAMVEDEEDDGVNPFT